MTVFHAIDPASGEPLEDYPTHGEADARRILDAAGEAFADWRRWSLYERAARLERLADLLSARRPQLARPITREMGKPLAEALAEVDKAEALCRWLCAEGVPALEPRVLEGATVERAPVGGVLAIMPWSFPLWQPLRCAAPALLAGDVVSLKPAPSVPGVAAALERLLTDAGFPPGVFSVLRTDHQQTLAAINHPAIARVSLTGSSRAGRAVAAACGGALKRSVLELGASDALIVLDDGDVEAAAAAALEARLRNAGQTCTAPKRLILCPAVAEPMIERLRAGLEGLEPQHPDTPGARLGPLGTRAARDRLGEQLTASLAGGAVAVVAGGPLARPGWWFQPALLDRVEPGQPAFDEETFGPLLAVSRARDPEHAIALAGASRFGLGASIWSADPERARRLAARLEVGTLAINDVVRSRPELPFGGVKGSGSGRELGLEGLGELTDARVVLA